MRTRVLFWGSAVVFPLPLVLVLNFQLSDTWPVRCVVSAGVVAYSWWLLAILLSSRPSWLDRKIGLPSIYRLHGLLGLAAVAVAYLHRENSFSADRTAAVLGEWAFLAAAAVLIYSVFFLSGWVVDRSRLLRRARSLSETFLRRRFSLWVHRLNLVIVAAIWLHVHLIDKTNELIAFMILFDAYTVVVLGVHAWKKLVAPDGYLAGHVAAADALNASTSQVSIALDHRAEALRAGDFLFLQFTGRAWDGEWHPFSVTDVNRDVLTFAIRHVGDFTRSVGQIRVGTRVRLEGPFGRFDSLVERTTRDIPLVFLGMGTGIAPLLSLTAQYRKRRQINLLWSVHEDDDLYYRPRLEDYQRESAERLNLSSRIGRFHRQDLASQLSPAEIKGGEFFVVGPSPAVLGMQRTLRSLGVARERVHHERVM